MATLALDIETISPGKEAENVDFLDSRDFEILCVGIGHRLSSDHEPETHIIWREGIGAEHEYKTLDELLRYLDDHHFDTILTYNGGRFDFRHLRGRAAILSDECSDYSLYHRMHRALQRADHRDLFLDVEQRHSHRLSLEDTVEEYIGENSFPASWRGDIITSGDIPDLGELWLTHKEGLETIEFAEQLETALTRYVESDINPLFELYDELEKQRVTN